MASLEPPDLHFYSAALGWYELGNQAEAEAELKRVSKEGRRHPDVLELKWLFQSRRDDWEGAAKTAKSLMKHAPDRASGWLHYSYSLRRASDGGLDAAWKALLPAYEKFPGEPVLAYNLACYACQLDRLDDAREWFAKALKIEERKAAKTVGLLLENLYPDSKKPSPSGIKQMALRDEDLKPLWPEIERL